MNIETWGYIRHLYFGEKLSKKAIARHLNLDPKTIRRALKKTPFPGILNPDHPNSTPFGETSKTCLRPIPA